MSTEKILVGYTTRTVPEEWLDHLKPEFEGRKGTKDSQKIAEQIEEKEKAWRENCAAQPYTGTFDTVALAHLERKETKTWKSNERQPFGTKPAISLLIRNYLLKSNPNAWSGELLDYKEPQVVFIGFGIRRFLKMLGLECSLPWIGEPAPVKLWFSNADHRDIESAVMPSDFKSLDWKSVIWARRNGLNEKDVKGFDRAFASWSGPGVDAEHDLKVITTLVNQLGFGQD